MEEGEEEEDRPRESRSSDSLSPTASWYWQIPS
jgi:hypothetical protein